MVRYGIYKFRYDNANNHFISLESEVSRAFQNVQIKRLSRPDIYLYIYQIESDEKTLDKIFRKFNIFPLSEDECVGFIKKSWSPENPYEEGTEEYTNWVAPTVENTFGLSGSEGLSDVEFARLGKLAWERFHMDSSSKFIVSDSFADLLKALTVVADLVVDGDFTEDQKDMLRGNVQRLYTMYGGKDHCLTKFNDYVDRLQYDSGLETYANMKYTVLTSSTVEDIWDA